MRYQIELKISAMKSSIYSSSADIIADIFLLVFTCRIVKCLLKLEMPNMQVTNSKFYFPREVTIEELDSLHTDTGQRRENNNSIC